MKSTIKLSLFALLLALGACVTPSKITYIKDMEYGREYPVKPAPELKVQQEDKLGIRVFSEDEALAKPFNIGALTQMGAGTTQAAMYVVDTNGEIEFPVLGKINVEGLTMKEVQAKISNMIIAGGYIRQPVVSVSLENFRITLVKYGQTQQLDISAPSVNLLQIVAPDQGEKIKEVQVIRTVNGVRKAYCVDFQTIALFDSPVFYLQQNDIVYVKPKRWMTSQTGQAIRQTVTMLMTLAGTGISALTLLKLYRK